MATAQGAPTTHARNFANAGDAACVAARLATQPPSLFRRCILLPLLWAAAASALGASNVVEYTYDAAGNIVQIGRQAVPGFQITGFDPRSGPAGTQVTIYGAGFDPVAANNSVAFNGIAAAVTASANGSLLTSVPAGASTGRITVTVGGATATSTTDFVVTLPSAPTITSFTPPSGSTGATISVSGTNFDPTAGASVVKVNGVAAAATVSNPTELSLTVPGNVASGKLTVTTAGGTAVSPTDFIVPPPGMATSDIAATVRAIAGAGNVSMAVPTGKSGLVLFDAQPDVYYSIQFAGVAISPSTATAAYELLGPDNTVLITGSIGGNNRPSVHLPKLSAAGTYSLVLSPGSATLNTNLRVDVNPVITVDGAAASSTLDFPYQSARFVFDAAAGQRIGLGVVGVAFTPAAINTPYNGLRVFRPDGTEILPAPNTCAGQTGSNPEGNCDGELLAPVTGTYTAVLDSCATRYDYNVLVSDYSIMPFSGGQLDAYGSCSQWAESVIFSWRRQAGCPVGYSLSGGDTATPCVKFPPCKECAGNPVDIGTGAKMQRETDYRSPAPGGLAFERFFNSAGFFDLESRMETAADKWRHTYSIRVIPYPASNAYVMAAVQEADGTVRQFNLGGIEIQNNDGAANRLEKLTDSSGGVTGWRLTTANMDVDSFDAQGRLTGIITRTGFSTTLAYNASGQLASATDTYGRVMSFTYDASGRLATMTDPALRVYQYAYDSSGNPVSVTFPDGSVRTYLYEDPASPNQLTGIVDERGVRLATYAYDAKGFAISTQHAGDAEKYTFNYTNATSTVTVAAKDAFNSTHTYTYSKIGGVLKRTSLADPISGTVTTTFDANGNPLTRVDRNGNRTTFVYDAARNLETSRTEASGKSVARTITTTWHPTFRLPATITEPSGVAGVDMVTTFTYDSAGNLTRKNITASAISREWNYTYNGRGQVLTIDGPRTDSSDVTTLMYFADDDACIGCQGQVHTVTNAATQVTTFDAYDADGRPTQITDPNGVVTTLSYEPRGWLASRTTAGEATTYAYDAAGNLTKVTLPDGSWIAYAYDDASRMVGVDDSFGDAIDYQLDLMGNRVAERVYDPQQSLRTLRQRVYDGANRLQRDLGAASQTTQYDYDPNGNVRKVTDPLSRVTTNTYDALDRLININDPANGNTVFTYDAKDHLKTVKDPKLSATTTYNYDGLGNLTSQVSPDTGTTSFTYDAAGNVATQTDARGTVTTYSYDALNRVTAATVADGTVSYEYDDTTTGGPYALGRLTKVTDPSGHTTYAYDALGRVTSKAQTVTANPSDVGFAVAYSYANGRQTGITYPSGRSVTYGFDAGGRIASVSVDGTPVLSAATYVPFGAASGWTWGNGEAFSRTFDLDGRVKTITMGPGAGLYDDLAQAFTYDSLNRLVTANLAAGQSQDFTYDANGNRTSATINAASTTYSYPSTSHRLASLSGAGARSFSYDNAGNLTSSAGITYAYDGRGRMKQAGTATYAINGLGQRVKKNNGTDVLFAYDEAGHLIGEYDATGTPIEETVWLGDLPVAVVKPNAASFEVFYIWTDNLGTPRLITDTANQSRWEWPNADPFGNNLPNEDPAGLGAFSYNLRFPGQYYDAEKGSSYNYFRDYDPSIGRYVESDPIGLRGGINTYGYVQANPLRAIDPLGLVKWKAQVFSFSRSVGTWENYDVVSECKCGREVHARIQAKALSYSSDGFTWAGSYTELEDHAACPDAYSLEGLYSKAGGGFAGLVGASYSSLILGSGESRGFGWEVGFDVGIGATIGTSRVVWAFSVPCRGKCKQR
jgi:RHS repeat-associated protein